ncbi:tetratricopeptide repeat-containing sensor histidine kinase [Urechidicola croceus]|uniref:Signal transduction histidine kinase internal region domain-containing protein n=1 Tax=Urechidicola croceus TaxID=1850246 RepID=A0A1D8P4X9_9FLAO|nr:tetratricopeptide repeat protein [Urechidicola croceus]AOW19662.1 hypothetical protein LPB138_02745 [Urechidicola croceus]
MRFLYLTTFLFLFVNLSFSQKSEIDSLNSLLKNDTIQKVSELHILNELAYKYLSVDALKGVATAQKAIELAKSMNNVSGLAEALSNNGHNLSILGQDTLAIKNYGEALEIYKNNNDAYGEAKAYYNLGRIHFNWSDYNQSSNYYMQAFEMFKVDNNKPLMAKMLNSLGINNMYLNNYPEAMSNYLDALKIHDSSETKNSLSQAQVFNNLALLNNRMEDFQGALKYYEKSLNIYNIIENKQGIAMVTANIATAYDNLGDSNKAIEMYDKAYELEKEIGNKTGMANALTNTGIAYSFLSNYDKTIEYLNKTKPIYKELGNKNNLAIVYSYLGEAYFKSENTNYLKLSETNILKAIELFEEIGNQSFLIESLNTLAIIEERKGNFNKAFSALSKATKLKDSIFSKEKDEEIANLKLKYEVEKKESELNLKHAEVELLAKEEIKRQKMIKNSSIIGGIGLFIVSVLVLFLFKNRQNLISKQKKAEFESKVAETELKALRAQMNPHFIFNSLNSIGDYIENKDNESAHQFITKFAKLMRVTLENSSYREIPLDEDLEFIDLYLSVEKKRLNNKFTYEIKVSDDIDQENTLVPPLILQPFIENSIWHGLSGKNDKGHILVEIKKQNNMLICSVDDNGVGRSMTTNINKNKQSLGIQITKKRIEIINKQKHSQGDIKIIDKENNSGLRVEVNLPLELAF